MPSIYKAKTAAFAGDRFFVVFLILNSLDQCKNISNVCSNLVLAFQLRFINANLSHSHAQMYRVS